MRTRFAPSPTGSLHVGNARVALYNWLLARKEGGEFLLRIEDTDPERSYKAFEREILRDLKWFLGWRGEVVRQSERLDIYRRYASELLAEGKAYRCYCTPEELEAMRQRQLSEGRPPRYDRRCLRLSEGERRHLEAEGRRPSLRFMVPDEAEVSFRDLIFGPQTFRAEDLGDFIILRSDGLPTYNFACVIDDHLMGITHVLRGEDHLSNTPRQLLLYEALGWQPPEFGHLPLLLGPDGKPLSKRHGPSSLGELREMGIMAVALANYLAAIGGAVKEEVLEWEGMVEGFSLAGISRRQAVFDLKRLYWFNRAHLKRARAAELKKALQDMGWEQEVRDEVIEQMKEEVSSLLDLQKLLPIFSSEGIFLSPEAEKAIEGAEGVLRLALEELSRGKDGWLDRVLKEARVGKGRVFKALRAALTGETKGPELKKVVALLDAVTIRRRIEDALRRRGWPYSSTTP